MAKKLYVDPAAEKEATDIGKQFMHSSDVVGDMSRAYGTDLSSVRLHTDESAARAAAERGVDAYSTGKDVFFARGAFDRNDPASRGLLAHELSHSLQQGAGGSVAPAQTAPLGAEQGGLIDWFRSIFHRKKPEDSIRFAQRGESPAAEDVGRFFRNGNIDNPYRDASVDPRRQNMLEELSPHLSDRSVYGGGLNDALQNASGTTVIKGLVALRLLSGLEGPLGGDMSKAEVGDLYEKLLNGGRYSSLRQLSASRNGMTPAEQAEMDRFTPEQIAGMDAQFDEGMLRLKSIQLSHLRHLKEKYGILGTQMHPEDFLTRVGPEFFSDMNLIQDCAQMMVDGRQYFDFAHNKDDQEYRTLSEYYGNMYDLLHSYTIIDRDRSEDGAFDPSPDEIAYLPELNQTQQAWNAEPELLKLGARGFTKRQQRSYESRVNKRFKKNGLGERLFGRFLRG